MTVHKDILAKVGQRPGLTEMQIAAFIFGRRGYQQRVNKACRELLAEGRIIRKGSGGTAAPYTYHLSLAEHRLSD